MQTGMPCEQKWAIANPRPASPCFLVFLNIPSMHPYSMLGMFVQGLRRRPSLKHDTCPVRNLLAVIGPSPRPRLADRLYPLVGELGVIAPRLSEWQSAFGQTFLDHRWHAGAILLGITIREIGAHMFGREIDPTRGLSGIDHRGQYPSNLG